MRTIRTLKRRGEKTKVLRVKKKKVYVVIISHRFLDKNGVTYTTEHGEIGGAYRSFPSAKEHMFDGFWEQPTILHASEMLEPWFDRASYEVQLPNGHLYWIEIIGCKIKNKKGY